MGTVTYKEFLDNFASFGAQMHPIFNTNPSPHEQNAELLHSLFCMNMDCTWEEEEEELNIPWAGHDHLYWANMSEKFESAGISMNTAISNQAAVLALVGIQL